MTVREGRHRKRIHLAAHSGDQSDVETLVRLAHSAERGSFDFLLIGGSATLAMPSALAAVTERLGLVATVDTTHNEPFVVARQFATLDHLSDGRSGWNVASSADPDRYPRAEEFLAVARAFWDSWEDGEVPADEQTGVYVDPGSLHTVDHRGAQFDVRGFATLPAGPQGHPILLQDGDSAEGREFGAKHADVLVVAHATLEAGQRYYGDVKARVAALGRDPDRLKVFASVTVAVGDDRSRLGGTPEQVAAAMDSYVQADACDGFLLAPHGLDEFVDAVVPLLQERGVFRTDYRGFTLREHLGIGSSEEPGP